MLGLRFSRLVRAAIASGALVLAACPRGGGEDTDTDTDGSGSSGDMTTTLSPTTTIDPTTGPPPPPGDITPPALVSATLLDPQTLQLSFTEPIAPVDTVNPKRFRFSFAIGYFGAYDTQQQTFLRDPRYFNYTQNCVPCQYGPFPDYCYYQPYYCYFIPSDEILVAELYNHYSDPNSLLLFLTEPIRPSLCNAINNDGDPKFSDAVLHLHYADGGLAQITDLAGIPLGPDGKFWVQYDGNYYTYIAPAFSNFTPFVPIPCPFV